MRLLREFLIALSFFSRIPISLDGWNQREVREVSKFFTAVGYIPGLIFMLGRETGNFVGYVLSLAIGYWLFDLFHFDGLLDTIDGFLSPGDKNKVLEVMSKGDVGAFAVFYGVLYLITYVHLFTSLDPVILLYGSVFGRLSMNFLLHLSKPAKSGGLGRAFYPYDKANTLVSLIFALPLAIYPVIFLIGIVVSFSTAFFMAYISERKIGGYTGDVLGGCCLLSQIAFLGVCYLA